MMRNLHKRKDEMQSKYEEELKALCVENAVMWQGRGAKSLAPSTSTLSKLTKQSCDKPNRTI